MALIRKDDLQLICAVLRLYLLDELRFKNVQVSTATFQLTEDQFHYYEFLEPFHKQLIGRIEQHPNVEYGWISHVHTNAVNTDIFQTYMYYIRSAHRIQTNPHFCNVTSVIEVRMGIPDKEIFLRREPQWV